MFGKFMNNYYYGKSGKGDYTPDDLPRNRWQLFFEMLRTRLSALCRLNLIYVIAWIPTIIVVTMLFTDVVTIINRPALIDQTLMSLNTAVDQGDGTMVVTMEDGSTQEYTPEEIESLHVLKEAYALDDELAAINNGVWREDGSVSVEKATGEIRTYTKEEIDALKAKDQEYMDAGVPDIGEDFRNALLKYLLLLIPCIFITGPWTAGMSYVTRNWARDEHAFIWSDFKDAMKENWKGSLVISGLTSVVPALAYMCYTGYNELAAESPLWVFPQMFTLMVMVMWLLAVTYTYPMLVTYKMSVKTVIRNSFILAVGRLPYSLGVRLLHCVPVVIVFLLMNVINNLLVPLFLLMYYVLFGFGLSRFITASYTNAMFDKYINSRIEGAKVNRGMTEDDDDDWDDEDEEEDAPAPKAEPVRAEPVMPEPAQPEERELKPWENGYVSKDN